MLKDKSAILNRRLPHIDVECPNLGETVRVQAMSVKTHKLFESHRDSIIEGDDSFLIAYIFLVYSIVDDEGNLVFAPEDAESLENLPVKDVELLFTAAQEINGLIDNEEEVKKS